MSSLHPRTVTNTLNGTPSTSITLGRSVAPGWKIPEAEAKRLTQAALRGVGVPMDEGLIKFWREYQIRPWPLIEPGRTTKRGADLLLPLNECAPSTQFHSNIR